MKISDEVEKLGKIIKMQAQIIDQYRNAEIFSDEQMKTINDVLEEVREEGYKEGYEDGLKAKWLNKLKG